MSLVVVDIKRLISLLEEKHKLLISIIQLTKQQAITIKKEDIECLQELIISRKEKINKFNKIENKFLALFNKIKEENKVKEMDELNIQPQVLKKLKDETNNITQLLIEIKRIEKSNLDNLNKNLLNVKNKIHKIQKGKKASNNYYQTAVKQGGTFLDKRK